jgi:GNAT superfamily N-acetyltransferase
MHQLQLVRLDSESSIKELESLAHLRIEVFRSWPYLYNGSLDYEIEYLKKYMQSQRSAIFLLKEGDTSVGATTCLPLADVDEVKQPFIDKGLSAEDYFYFGESVILEPYRGLGWGHQFFNVREQWAANWSQYRYTCFCAVDRPNNHPQKPLNYRGNETFWIKRGYIRYPELFCQMEWQDILETKPTFKNLTFWIKPI